MNDITPRDRREAEKWVARMLDEPDRHRAGLSRWMLGKPGRRLLYERLMMDVEDVTSAFLGAKEAGIWPPKTEEPSAVPPATPKLVAPKTRSRFHYAAAAVFILLVLSAGAAFVWRPAFLPGMDASHITIATAAGQTREEKLADGTMLRLDENSLVHVRLASGERQFELKKGQARFAIPALGGRPFVVTAAGSEIVAAGGIFDLSLRNRLAIRLEDGAVEVRLPGWRENARPSRLVRLNAGQTLAFAGGAHALPSIRSSAPQHDLGAGGAKSFDEVAVRDIIAEANGRNAVKIILSDPSLGARRIFGEIRIDDAEATASAIATYLRAQVDRSKPGRLLIRK